MRRPLLLPVVLLAATALAVPAYAASTSRSHPGVTVHGADRVADRTPDRGVARGVKHVPVPKAARAVDTSHPDHVIGNGTPASCTSKKVVRAVAKGGVITFACGPDPVVITMRRPAKVVNTSRRVVIDGGGLVTLSGGGKRRILYQNTCDQGQI